MSFCKELRQAVQAQNKVKVAAWINSYPIQVEFVPVLYPTGFRGEKTSTLVADNEDFVEKFGTIFNEDVTRALFSNSGCELLEKPDGSARIANGSIFINQFGDDAKTIIEFISPPENFGSYYRDQITLNTGAKNFLLELQRAVRNNDAKFVAPLCSYPLMVNSGSNHVTVENRAALTRDYSHIFTAQVRAAILNPASPTQVGWRGFMVENGTVWFDAVVGTDVFRVHSINVPEFPRTN